jgi:hypothetical protein
MSGSADRLYELLPAFYRERDANQGEPLRALLRVIGEQVDVVEADVAQLYENWFIETCEDWVVPYVADLIGYRPVHEAGEAGEVLTRQGRERNKALIPRREVANTLRYRRRKGTLALLELLARDVAGWPARAVEFRLRLGWTQSVRHLRPDLGRTVDLRDALALERLDGPFDEIAHTVEVRRLASQREPGRYGLAAVGLFLWRLRPYPVTAAPAYCIEKAKHHFTFSALGNDVPLFVRPQPESTDPTAIAGPLELPVRLTRRALAANVAAFYGEGKSFLIQVGKSVDRGEIEYESLPADSLVAADLTDWKRMPPADKVAAVDPELGRIVFRFRKAPRHGVRVVYHYGFPAELGGGEYDRPIRQAAGAEVLRVGAGQTFERILDALAWWQKESPDRPAVIEIADSNVYTEQLKIELAPDQRLQIRAAVGKRPIVRIMNWETSKPDALFIYGSKGSRIVLDGLLIAGQSVYVQGPLAALTLRHSTLVPGWDLEPDCHPSAPAEPSLELVDVAGTVTIEHSILGTIQVQQDEVRADPLPIRISDSILDATDEKLPAVESPVYPRAHAVLTVVRSTVFGKLLVHAIELAENSIFEGEIRVARRQIGCMRFCSLLPGSRTPRRFHCQPELAEQAAMADIEDPAERAAVRERERQRVRPRFDSRRYGSPVYARLSIDCAEEIWRGADDESEMGVYHDLYEPQRAANLRVRLDEYTPAGLDAGLVIAS